MKITDYSGVTTLTNTVKVPVIQDNTLKLAPVETFDIDRPVFVTNRNEFLFQDNLYVSNGSGSPISRCFRSKRYSHKTLVIAGPRLVFANSRITANGEVTEIPILRDANGTITNSASSPNANNIYVRASIENPAGGTHIPVWFNGKREVTIEPGGFAISDPVGITLPADTAFFIRTNVRVAFVGDVWPQTHNSLPSGEGETFTNTDNVDTATAMTTFFGGAQYAPVAILGSVKQKVPSILLVGSSSTFGQGDDFVIDNTTRDYGYLARLLNNEFCYAKHARASGSLLQMTTDSRRRLALAYAMQPTHVIIQHGGNDINNGASFEAMQTRMQTVWAMYSTQGIKVIQSTITPTTTSTDGWTSKAGQTVDAQNGVRTAVNDWLRSNPAGLWGVIDPAVVVEDPTDSGLWRSDLVGGASWTSDGTHLRPAAHAAVATALVPAKSLFGF